MLVIRGKIAVKVNEKQKPVGFKFIVTCDYPTKAPLLFLDEKEDQVLIEMLDYLDNGNRVIFTYLTEWPSRQANEPNKYNLKGLLYETWQLFSKAPPFPFDEIFG